jgi:carbon storage regulator
MLILTRRPGETIFVGENKEVQITVLGVKGNQVRVGISAPKNVPVHREEVQLRIDSGMSRQDKRSLQNDCWDCEPDYQE